MSKYFGVIGNRDHIKIGKGTDEMVKRPFWEFLDAQPCGWLTSLAYKRDDVPEGLPRIWDCGAWSYKLETIPKLGSTLIDAESALELYLSYAVAGDFVVAPDHMYATDDPAEISHRRIWNGQQAAKFLRPAHDAGFRPMAVVHGVDIKERVKNAKRLVSRGYDALSIGGVAFKASSRKAEIAEIVDRVRQAAPDVWLHVLGLSAPNFLRMWIDLGVDSFDGASHFKQAFTGGAFFTQEDDRLIKHKAARSCRETYLPIEEITAPECDCTACSVLRSENIDTRTYGSNEHNMGRAAHNLNMLMRAHDFVRSETKCATLL